MRTNFNQFSSLPAVERALKRYEIEYKKLPGGRIIVPGDIQLNMENLKELPDFTDVIVMGNFECMCNQLTSLKGAPKWVGGDFMCMGNPLTSLEHAPRHVGGDFECNSDDLYSLEGAPKAVGGKFSTHACPLPNLEHAPVKFKALVTALGTFTSWDDVPQKLKMSDETKARLHEEALLDDAVMVNTVLQTRVCVTKPLSFRMQAAG
ncbi:MAG: hypothetical protein ACAH80_16910 [Alphaproteobacteria bacterium]